MSPWLAVVVVYGVALFGLSLYSLNHAVLAWVFWRRRPRSSVLHPAGPDPVVTIQLPLFNELYVAERLIRSACEVDYPAHLLEIQVLDDSTDETLDLTRRLVREYQARGVSIVHVHRDDRTGFKSGALARGFTTARGEFIAVFDADFVVPRDFLRRTLPHFADPSLGIVQTRWAYFNDNFSELHTRNGAGPRRSLRRRAIGSLLGRVVSQLQWHGGDSTDSRHCGGRWLAGRHHHRGPGSQLPGPACRVARQVPAQCRVPLRDSRGHA